MPDNASVDVVVYITKKFNITGMGSPVFGSTTATLCGAVISLPVRRQLPVLLLSLSEDSLRLDRSLAAQPEAATGTGTGSGASAATRTRSDSSQPALCATGSARVLY